MVHFDTYDEAVEIAVVMRLWSRLTAAGPLCP